VGASAVALLVAVEVEVEVEVEEETELVDVLELRPGRSARRSPNKPRTSMLLSFWAVVWEGC
jgi:hypothetical protein